MVPGELAFALLAASLPPSNLSAFACGSRLTRSSQHEKVNILEAEAKRLDRVAICADRARDAAKGSRRPRLRRRVLQQQLKGQLITTRSP
eukprot:691052-Pleurochrysis_carterae.AAC.1